MTKYSNPRKAPNQYAKGLHEHFLLRRREPTYTGRSRTPVNDCFKPSADASKADLREYHREEMALRRARRAL